MAVTRADEVRDHELRVGIYGRSPLTGAYAAAWDNDVHFHVAQNLLFLRRYRHTSQVKLAEDVKTSQSAIARIESAQENITLATLQRMIAALKGRLRLSIAPAEMQLPEWQFQWWNVVGTGFCSANQWTFRGAESRGIGPANT
jgi:Helix-turn-helix